MLLKELITEQKEKFLNSDYGVKREIEIDKYISNQQIFVLSGIRRSGKSTLLRQLSEKFDDFNYVNFDDERLINFTVDNFNDLMVIFSNLSKSKVIITDKIQNVKYWERFVRRIHDEGYKVILTGSNAKMLSRELGTHLTGRYFKIELFPFSFREYLSYKEVDTSKITTAVKSVVLDHFEKYLLNGGFPEYLKYDDTDFLKQTYEDILYRDIISRYNIKKVKEFKQLSHYLFSNFTGDFNFNAIKKALNYRSATSVKTYLGYLEESYLLFELSQYDFSLKKQYFNAKKYFVIDNGMRNIVSFNFSKNLGKFLENLVFIELKRKGLDIYFLRENKRETDFITIDKVNNEINLYQVCFDLNADNREREIKGLLQGMRKFQVDSSFILTYDLLDEIKKDDKSIKVIPVWRWLLNKTEWKKQSNSKLRFRESNSTFL